MTKDNKRPRLQQGLVQVYTGTGKGKTTAALGLGLRAVGVGLKVLVVQFLKGGNTTGELASAKIFGDQFVIRQIGSGVFNFGRKPTPEEVEAARQGLSFVKDQLAQGSYDIVVLDEISHAINLEYLNVAEVMEAIRDRQPQTEVVLTGRNMPDPLIDLADLVSKIEAVKHPLDRGIKARKGIEG